MGRAVKTWSGGRVVKWLVKVEPVHRAPPGLEWRLLRRLPWILVGGLLVLAVGAQLSRLLVADGPSWEVAAAIRRTDFALLGALFYFIDLLMVTAIGCVIVMIMKGPRYSADSYEIPHADRPPDRAAPR